MPYLLLVLLGLTSLISVLAVASNSDFTIYQKRVPVAFPRHGSEALRRAYAKFGVPVPAHLERRGQQGTAANRPYNFVGDDNYPDDEYLSTICIGIPGQELTIDLDTGSSDLCVFEHVELAHRSYCILHDEVLLTLASLLDGCTPPRLLSTMAVIITPIIIRPSP